MKGCITFRRTPQLRNEIIEPEVLEPTNTVKLLIHNNKPNVLKEE